MRGIVPILAVVTCASVAQAGETLAAEQQRRQDQLMREGYNLTHRVRVSAATKRDELIIPAGDADEHRVSLWFAAEHGELAVRFLDPKGDVVVAWHGRSGDQQLTRVLAPGRYVVEFGGSEGLGAIGVKGPVVAACPLDALRVSEHAADPGQGFHWPYLLLAPSAGAAKTLLVVPNNTGFPTEDLELLRASASCELAHEIARADRLGVAVLVPLFPRTEEVYLHALARSALATKAPKLARADLQLIAMIDDARRRLGPTVRSRVLMSGFSASGSFTNRFALLHPDRVLAAAVGSPGGWPIAPSAELRYPVGVADVAELTGRAVDFTALRTVSLFLFLGDADTNDSVPYRDSFSAADQELIMRRFGETPVARWNAAKQLYDSAKLRATFRLYPGVAHDVTAAMAADVEAAFAAALRD
jgi:dienelactone hydrolase